MSDGHYLDNHATPNYNFSQIGKIKPLEIKIKGSRYPSGTFAQRLKKLRVENGLKQRELALKAGLSREMVYRWEKGLSRPSKRLLKKVASVLNTTMEYLMGGKDRE